VDHDGQAEAASYLDRFVLANVVDQNHLVD
jgi:hypothetical protein